MTPPPPTKPPAVSIPFDQAFAIAHAMNNLLAIVAAQLDLIHEAPGADPGVQDRAALGLLANERAARLMRGMMASLGGRVFRAGWCDSEALLHGVEAMRRAPGLAGIEIEAGSASLGLLCDPVALSDLLGNTLDVLGALPGRPIRLSCAPAEQPAPHLPSGSFVELRIAGGIPSAELDWRERAMGEDWRQALRRFCRAAGGELLLDASGDDGTLLIRLCLPGLAGAQPQAAAPLPKQVRVLVVEDDDPVREHAERVIASLGYAVRSVPGAEAALEVIESGAEVDVVFTDVIMPGGMSGGELAERLQDRKPELPILFTSGHHADTRVSRLLLHHGAKLLPKPYRRSSLAAALAAVVERGRDDQGPSRG